MAQRYQEYNKQQAQIKKTWMGVYHYGITLAGRDYWHADPSALLFSRPSRERSRTGHKHTNHLTPATIWQHADAGFHSWSTFHARYNNNNELSYLCLDPHSKLCVYLTIYIHHVEFF